MRKPLIGVVALGHAVYFPQFPGLREELERKSVSLIRTVAECGAEALDVGYVDRVEGAFEAVRRIRARDPDLLLLLLTTYVPSAVCAPFARYLDVPQVLVGIQPLAHLDYANTTTFMQLCNDDVCAMPEAAGVYRRMGRDIPPCLPATAAQKDYIVEQVRQWVAAAAARAAFRFATIGYLGHTYEGMYDMHTDPTAFTAAFGAHVKMLEMCELSQIADDVSDREIAAETERIRQTFEICDPSADPLTEPVQNEDLALSARLSCALRQLVENHGLAALAYYYQGMPGSRYEQLAANLIVGNTFLTSSGIPLAGEADLKTAAAMLIMNRLGGGGSFAEIHPFDSACNTVLVGHDGPHNFALAQGKPKLRKLSKYHGKAGSGIGVEFSLKTGPVTMLSITVDHAGALCMVAARGTSCPGEIPRTGNTNTRVTFDCPVEQFLTRWCEAGPTHHFALGCGDHLEALRKYARISGIPLTVVS